MSEAFDYNRRRFLGAAAAAIAGAQAGTAAALPSQRGNALSPSRDRVAQFAAADAGGCAAKSSSSTSGRIPASIGCGRYPTCARGRRRYKRPGTGGDRRALAGVRI